MNKILVGDCLIKLKELEDNSVDSIVTDPPAGISFMGKSWDGDKGGRDSWIKWMSEVATECKRVLKPGGHAFVWAIPRTSHWTATAWENAGFEIRDVVAHVFGSGFPKSANIQKHLEKKGSDRADEFTGIGTALKPAREDWLLMRKPLAEKTVAENCLRWGTGGINIDESRVGFESEEDKEKYEISTESLNTETFDNSWKNSSPKSGASKPNQVGRFPANLIHDNSEEVRECFPETKASKKRIVKFETSGYKERFEGGVDDNGGNASRFFKSIKKPYVYSGKEYNVEGFVKSCKPQAPSNYNDEGSPARYFKSIIYQAKASKSERNKGCEELEEKAKVFNGQSDKPSTDMKDVEKRFTTLPKANNHPTVKPIALMEYLIKMVTPKGGIVLDPFAGSGSTLVAAKQNGFQYIGIEMTEEYIPIINARLNI